VQGNEGNGSGRIKEEGKEWEINGRMGGKMERKRKERARKGKEGFL